ncbi:hypothetical protein WA026_016322 [Henosepilachna vigintioctopunctata]|uniref:Uncharacterized protein n=1 Tax=Henosepilachna vigintioctopunctata TaxID=420089 RepID=A0AAW1UN31_9CUCU
MMVVSLWFWCNELIEWPCWATLLATAKDVVWTATFLVDIDIPMLCWPLWFLGSLWNSDWSVLGLCICCLSSATSLLSYRTNFSNLMLLFSSEIAKLFGCSDSALRSAISAKLANELV